MAADELETIARTLPNDAFAPFLSCLSVKDSSEKSPVRRQCVRLISVLSSAHGDVLSPHVPRMISAVLRRLRDPDSAVRAACVDAVASIASHVSSLPFSVIMKPLVDALFQEQDLKPQVGAALCLAAAVEAAPEPDLAELRKLLPRALKLVRSNSCKAKSALISLIGCIVGSDCVKSKGLLSSIVCTTVDFLSSKDWAARKEAAEVLEKLAVVCRSLAAEFKASCVAALESRRLDKVKLEREKMNRALEIWKDVPCQSSSPNCNVTVYHLGCSEKVHSERSSSPTKRSPAASSCGSSSSNAENEDNKTCDPSSNVPSELMMIDEDDSNNMSLIFRQLQQIEEQQSNLLDLLQKLMGSSDKGMISLEQRVNGLEKTVSMMSHDFGMSTQNTCCVVSGEEC